MAKIIYPLMGYQILRHDIKKVIRRVKSMHTKKIFPVMPELSLVDIIQDQPEFIKKGEEMVVNEEHLKWISLKVISNLFKKGVYDSVDCSYVDEVSVTEPYTKIVLNEAWRYSVRIDNLKNVIEILGEVYGAHNKIKPIDNNINIIHVAHHIGSKYKEAIEENISKIKEICKGVHSQENIVVPFYLGILKYLNDYVKEERALGIKTASSLLKRGAYDKCYLCVSEGIASEILNAREIGMDVSIYHKKLPKEKLRIVSVSKP